MADFKLGRLKFVWKGEWTTATAYVKDDIVSYGGSSYVCIEVHTSTSGFSTDLSANRWELMAAGGTASVTTNTVYAPATSGTLNINADVTNVYVAEGLTGGITFNAPSGTPVNGQRFLIRLRDNGTNRSISWTTTSEAFRPIGLTLPTTTTANKLTYIGCVYHSTDSFWDVIAVVTET